MPAGRVWVLGLVSIVLWNVLLFWLGSLFGLQSQVLVKRVVWIATILFVLIYGWIYLNMKLRKEIKGV